MKLQQEKHRIELEQMNEIHQAKLHILDLERQLADEKLRKFRTSITSKKAPANMKITIPIPIYKIMELL